MNGLIYGPSGAGKTVNATLVATGKRGRNLLICSDNSHIVLKNFDRPKLDIITVSTADEFVKAYDDACTSNKYDNIILDNLSDLFDMWITELGPKTKDIRQAYQYVYQELKLLSRKSANQQIDTLFTAWSDVMEMTNADGNKYNRMQPKLPYKILDNVCGLMNVVGYVASGVKDGKKVWWYKLSDPNGTYMCKDQVACRDFCKPEEIFLGKETEPK